MTKQLDDAIRYFKQNKGFRRPFEQIRKKYESLGNLGGTILLQKLTKEEKEALSGFFRKDYHHQASAKISVKAFEKALEDTRFQGLSFMDILEGYFGEALVSKKESENLYETRKISFFQEIIEDHRGTPGGKWLQALWEENGNAYRLLSQRYDSNPKKLQKDLGMICKALETITTRGAQKERLPLFASKITTNPHGFDEGTELHTLLLYGLMGMYGVPMPRNAEEKAELFYKVGIIKDDLSNYTLCTGLLAYEKGELHEGWKGFYDRGEPLQVSLWNLSKIERVQSPQRNVYVVENPTVFSEILENGGEQQVPMICTYGQVKLASLILMDLLVQEGTVIYYSGDFDPEGLLIADRLKERYREQLRLWRYAIQDYKRTKSTKRISESRLKKINKLKNSELQKLGNVLVNEKYAGYQELMIYQLLEDINLK